MIGNITMSKKLTTENIQNKHLSNMLYEFEKAITFECEVLNNEFNSQAKINYTQKKTCPNRA